MQTPRTAITVTGLDERTDLAALHRWVSPQVEFGILYTATPENRNRYPRRDWINEAIQALPGQCALHVCGRQARLELARGELDDIVRHVRRVQVNGVLSADEASACARPGCTLITQHCPGNEALTADIPGIDHALLVDGSGGRGLLPPVWSRPATAKKVGFAGGLGPDTLVSQWPALISVAQNEWWIDMEGRLRNDADWFSVELASEAISLFQELCATQSSSS